MASMVSMTISFLAAVIALFSACSQKHHPHDTLSPTHAPQKCCLQRHQYFDHFHLQQQQRYSCQQFSSKHDNSSAQSANPSAPKKIVLTKSQATTLAQHRAYKHYHCKSGLPRKHKNSTNDNVSNSKCLCMTIISIWQPAPHPLSSARWGQAMQQILCTKYFAKQLGLGGPLNE